MILRRACFMLSFLVAGTVSISCSDKPDASSVRTAGIQGEPIQGAPIDEAPPSEPTPSKEISEPGETEPVTSSAEVADSTDLVASKLAEKDFLTAKNPAQHRINLPGALEKGKKPLEPNADGVIEVSFGHLASFPYLVADPFLGDAEPEVENVIPPRIQALNGKHVQVEGFMIPLDFNNDDEVTLFILSAFVDNCCFGKQANVNEWIEVELGDDQGVEFYPDGVVQVRGKLEVGELEDAYGYVSGIYRMRAEEVIEIW